MKSFSKILFGLGLLFLTVNFLYPNTPADTTTNESIYGWTFAHNYYEIKNVEIDTNLAGFQLINPALSKPVSGNYLGNMGSAFMNNYYPERQYNSRFLFIQPYEIYIKQYQNNAFYNTRIPFTRLFYSTGGQKAIQEQVVSVFHTQNIKPYFNAGIRYKLLSSEGQYQHQKKAINTFSFFSSFEKNVYNAFLDFNFNKLELNKNGGITDTELLADEELNTTDIPVKLDEGTGSFSKINNINLLLVQKVSLSETLQMITGKQDSISTDSVNGKPPRIFSPTNLNQSGGFITHVFEYKRNHYTYNLPQISLNDDFFYNNIYIDSTFTRDSAYHHNITNTLQLEIHDNPQRDFKFGLRAGISHEVLKYTIPGVGDTTYVFNNNTFNNIFISGGLYGGLGNFFELVSDGKLYLIGYNAGDLDISATMTGSFTLADLQWLLTLHGNLKRETPSFLYQKYISNHVRWNHFDSNRLLPINSTMFKAAVTNNNTNLTLDSYYTLVDNYTYFNDSATADQTTLPLNILGISLKKTFTFWKFKSKHELIYQVSGNEDVLSLPTLSYFTSSYIEQWFFNRALHVQLGFDIRYFTKYSAYGNMPATSMYYTQNENNEIGNYPYIDVFLNFKVKRTNFAVKYDHVNTDLFSTNYFMALHYPMPQRMLKFGISWTFYD